MAEFGITPWGAWFVKALQSFDESGRLSRGKSYANTGKVTRLSTEGGTVIARVKGRSSPFYNVRIDFPAMSVKAQRQIFEIIESEPMLLARIVHGELPAELLEKMQKAGIELIPTKWSSMKRSCSCPDWGDPCKHEAAVYYMLAREMDRDPRILFRLRGIDLNSLSGGTVEEGLVFPFTLTMRGTAVAIPDGSPVIPRIRDCTHFVLSILPPRPSFAAQDFALVLAQFYHNAAICDEFIKSPGDDAAADALERRFSACSYSIDLACKPGPEDFPFLGDKRPLIVATKADGKTTTLAVAAAAGLFLSFSSDSGSSGYRFLYHAFRLFRSIRRAGAFIPTPFLDGNSLRIAWTPLPADVDIEATLVDLARFEPGLLQPDKRSKKLVSGKSCVELLAAAYLGEWILGLGFRPSGEREPIRPFVDLFFHGEGIDISKPGERSLPGAVDVWLSVFRLPKNKYRYRITILAAQVDDEREPSFSLKLAVMIASSEDSLPEPVALKDAVAKTGDLEVLRLPTALSAYVPEMRDLALKASIKLSETRLSEFLGDTAGLLTRLGVEVIIPKQLKNALSPRLVLSADSKGSGSISLKSWLKLDDMLDYDWRIAMGDQIMDLKAFERLVKSKRSVILFHDGFLRLDPAEAARLLERVRANPRPGPLELIKARLSGDCLFSADAEALASSLFQSVDYPVPAGLTATLRPYQERGYRWILSNLNAGFGCILADDMGLGKTVQAIAVAVKLAEEGRLSGGALVVAPAALLTNWERELTRFAPLLSWARYHGPKRKLLSGVDITLTTYQTAVRDEEKLSGHAFDLLVVDEAHLMKNAHTRQSRTIKAMNSGYRLALSGTPVENKLEDLRSLFDFAIPGYLGGAQEFMREWRVPIELDRDAERAECLRRITAPFLMRRLKSDKNIISDLPDKVTIDEYATLAPEQAALYEGVVRKSLEAARKAEPGAGRLALILSMVTALKQICDHPRVYDKESPADSALSGKCGLLLSLLEEILERREKVIVFSQYVGTLELLQTIIADQLGEDCLLYHGGMGSTKRDSTVDRFQNDPSQRVMLVSLKAGGLGLNLTAASRVIHYDLWFNPAVENQATDRVFRIGQKRNVFVHRFITSGTFEEKIDAMLRSKRELADMSVASGESWLAKMSVDELKGIFER